MSAAVARKFSCGPGWALLSPGTERGAHHRGRRSFPRGGNGSRGCPGRRRSAGLDLGELGKRTEERIQSVKARPRAHGTGCDSGLLEGLLNALGIGQTRLLGLEALERIGIGLTGSGSLSEADADPVEAAHAVPVAAEFLDTGEFFAEVDRSFADDVMENRRELRFPSRFRSCLWKPPSTLFLMRSAGAASRNSCAIPLVVCAGNLVRRPE